MKTPRELLLSRHQQVSRKLDGIRHAAMTQAFSGAGLANSARRLPISPDQFTWRDLFASLRWHFAGLGAAWLVFLLLQLNAAVPSSLATVSSQHAPADRQMLLAVRENRRQLREWIDPSSNQQHTPAAPAAAPRPQSRRSSSTAEA